MDSSYYIQPEFTNENFDSNIIVGRNGIGSIEFKDKVNREEIMLGKNILFSKTFVSVEIPSFANASAYINFENIFPKIGENLTEFISKLKKINEKQDAKFMEYNINDGSWKFEVNHFSRYGLDDDEEEDDEEEEDENEIEAFEEDESIESSRRIPRSTPRAAASSKKARFSIDESEDEENEENEEEDENEDGERARDESGEEENEESDQSSENGSNRTESEEESGESENDDLPPTSSIVEGRSDF